MRVWCVWAMSLTCSSSSVCVCVGAGTCTHTQVVTAWVTFVQLCQQPGQSLRSDFPLVSYASPVLCTHIGGGEVSFSKITDGATEKLPKNHSKDRFIKNICNYQHVLTADESMFVISMANTVL